MRQRRCPEAALASETLLHRHAGRARFRHGFGVDLGARCKPRRRLHGAAVAEIVPQRAEVRTRPVAGANTVRHREDDARLVVHAESGGQRAPPRFEVPHRQASRVARVASERGLDAPAFGVGGPRLVHRAANARPLVLRHIAEEHDGMRTRPGLPPARVRGQPHPERVATAQLASPVVRRTRRVLLRAPRGVVAPHRDAQRPPEAGERLDGRCAVAACPADEVPALAQFEQHAVLGSRARPRHRPCRRDVQPQPGASRKSAERRSRWFDVPVGSQPALFRGVPGEDRHDLRNGLEERGSGGIRSQPRDRVPAGVQHDIDQTRRLGRFGGGIRRWHQEQPQADSEQHHQRSEAARHWTPARHPSPYDARAG